MVRQIVVVFAPVLTERRLDRADLAGMHGAGEDYSIAELDGSEVISIFPCTPLSVRDGEIIQKDGQAWLPITLYDLLVFIYRINFLTCVGYFLFRVLGPDG